VPTAPKRSRDGRYVPSRHADRSGGVQQADDNHSNCVAKVDVTHSIMHRCLEGNHDILLTYTNIDFWNSLGGPGSLSNPETAKSAKG
jgi:hypothetical protein